MATHTVANGCTLPCNQDTLARYPWTQRRRLATTTRITDIFCCRQGSLSIKTMHAKHAAPCSPKGAPLPMASTSRQAVARHHQDYRKSLSPMGYVTFDHNMHCPATQWHTPLSQPHMHLGHPSLTIEWWPHAPQPHNGEKPSSRPHAPRPHNGRHLFLTLPHVPRLHYGKKPSCLVTSSSTT